MQLYEAHGELMAVTTKKTKLAVHRGSTYQEYLDMPPARDREATVPLNLATALGGKKDGKTAHALQEAQTAAGKSGDGTADSRAFEPNSTRSSRFPFSGLSRKSRGTSLRHGVDCRSSVASGSADEETPTLGSMSEPVRVQVAGSGRHMKARMWLTPDSPINQKQLLPLLDIVGSTNQYIIKVCHRSSHHAVATALPANMLLLQPV
jgi:GPCR-chaperone